MFGLIHMCTRYSIYISLHTVSSVLCDDVNQVNEGVRMQENSDRLEWMQTHISMPDLKEVRVLWSTVCTSIGALSFGC